MRRERNKGKPMKAKTTTRHDLEARAARVGELSEADLEKVAAGVGTPLIGASAIVTLLVATATGQVASASQGW
jgi:hypothetical protein